MGRQGRVKGVKKRGWSIRIPARAGGSGGCHHSKMVKNRGNPLTAGHAYSSRTWEMDLGQLEVQGHPWLASIEISLALRNSVSKRRGVGRRRGKVEGKGRNENNSREEVDG